MKKAMIAVVLLLCACDDEARVLSSDATSEGYCNSDKWVTCISTACPNGFTVITRPSSVPGLVKCKP